MLCVEAAALFINAPKNKRSQPKALHAYIENKVRYKNERAREGSFFSLLFFFFILFFFLFPSKLRFETSFEMKFEIEIETESNFNIEGKRKPDSFLFCTD